jgi:coenzyme Q-binding protein COQ10
LPRHAETRFLPYTAEQIFDMVADVRRYAEFLPWVTGMRVRSDTPFETTADMIVGFKGLRETFTSRVRKVRPEAITVEYLDGPLKYLCNDWRFRARDGGCDVDFTVDFQFKNRIFEMLAGQVFQTALKKMIGAFEARAVELYGAPSSASAPAPGISSSSAHNAA